MPALLLHMTLAREMTTRADAAGPLAEAAKAAPDALLLGSILPDLPYHARFIGQLVRHLAGREYLLSEWGDVLHTRGTGRLALSFLAHARRSHLSAEARDRVLALAAGYLSHHTVDRVVHPVVNRVVERELGSGASGGAPPLRVHERIERHQSLFHHEDLLGHELPGSPYPRRMVGQMAGSGLHRPMLDEPLRRAFRAACLETHGRAPGRPQLSDWLWGTTVYGVLLSSPLGRLERPSGDRAQLRARYYRGPRIDLASPLALAQDVTVRAWRAGDRLLEADRLDDEARAVFLALVPDVDLGSGA